MNIVVVYIPEYLITVLLQNYMNTFHCTVNKWTMYQFKKSIHDRKLLKNLSYTIGNLNLTLYFDLRCLDWYLVKVSEHGHWCSLQSIMSNPRSWTLTWQTEVSLFCVRSDVEPTQTAGWPPAWNPPSIRRMWSLSGNRRCSGVAWLHAPVQRFRPPVQRSTHLLDWWSPDSLPCTAWLHRMATSWPQLGTRGHSLV